jgi:pimeloyl-ACP methyl ester carboxylesterase
VLVHGAWADGSSWSPVTERLQRQGCTVIAPANRLRGLAADSAYLASALESIDGPVVLVGHSYGGMVISNAATSDPDVKALVFVAAFAPAAGESIESLSAAVPGSQITPDALDFRHYPLPGGTEGTDAYVKAGEFRRIFAADLPRQDTAVLAATQRPIELHALGEPSGPPAWTAIPSWYLVASQDQVIPADGQRFMAHRADARTVEVRASHLVPLSKPEAVSSLILSAARR